MNSTQIGAIARRTRTITARDIELFTEITGDRNPIHYDEELARSSRFGGIVVQGGVTSGLLNALVAEQLPGPGSVFLEVSWRFLAPVRPGDVITAEATSPPRARTSRSRHCPRPSRTRTESSCSTAPPSSGVTPPSASGGSRARRPREGRLPSVLTTTTPMPDNRPEHRRNTMTITTENPQPQRRRHRDPVRHPRRRQGHERDRQVPVPRHQHLGQRHPQPVDDLRLLRRHAGDAAHPRDRGRLRPPGRARRRGQRSDARRVPAPRHRRLPDRRHRQHRRGPRGRADQGLLDRRGRHRPARDPRPLRRLGPQRLRADQGHLPHRGRRRRRDPARPRRAVAPPVRRLRRPHQPHARRRSSRASTG